MNEKMKSYMVRVAGVTFNGRQEVIARMKGNEEVKITPEPGNKYDGNALAVWVALPDDVYHVGYVPMDLAKKIAPALEGESVMTKVVSVVGGFEDRDGNPVSWGLRVLVTVPDVGDLPF